jgi:hypothetical protein
VNDYQALEAAAKLLAQRGAFDASAFATDVAALALLTNEIRGFREYKTDPDEYAVALARGILQDAGSKAIEEAQYTEAERKRRELIVKILAEHGYSYAPEEVLDQAVELLDDYGTERWQDGLYSAQESS